MTKLYIAGPMRGKPEFNFPAFFAAERDLENAGYETVNPARRDVDGGFDYKGMTGNENISEQGFSLRDALAWDLDQIAKECDGVALLDGWQNSKGARAEVATARALGLPVYKVLSWSLACVPQRKKIADSGITLSGLEEEIRTVSTTGGEKGQKLAQLGAIDAGALLTVAKVAGFGAQKYARYNFMRGYDWSLSWDACQRHLLAFWNGEDDDPESGLSHLGHAAWHCLAMLAFKQRELGTDDRYVAVD